MTRWVATVVIWACVAAPTSARAQAPSDPAAAPFSVEVTGVSAHIRHDFQVPPGFTVYHDESGNYIAVDLKLRQSEPPRIVSQVPGFTLRELTDADGGDLRFDAVIRAGVNLDWARYRLFELSSSETRDLNDDQTIPWCMIYPRSFPSSIRKLQGTVDLSVVSRDEFRELEYRGEKVVYEAGPGVRMWMRPRGDGSTSVEVGYTLPRLLSGGGVSVPLINQVIVTAGRTGRMLLEPDAFQRQSRALNASDAVTYLDFDPERDGSLVATGHVIHGVTMVSVPFSARNIPMTRWDGWSTALRRGARRDHATSFAARADDFEVRLLRITGATGSPARMARNGSSVTLSLGLADRASPQTRVFSRLPEWKIVSVLGPDGAPVATGTPASISDERGTGGTDRFRPRPILTNDRVSDVFEQSGRAAAASISLSRLPPRISVRGAVEFDVVTKSVTRDLPLSPGTETEIAPGVRLIVGDTASPRTVRPSDRADSGIQIQVRSSPYSREIRLPMVNLVQPIRADGKPGTPLQYTAEDPATQSIMLGRALAFEQGASVRVHVVLECERRAIPFYFDDIPVTDP